MIDLGKFSKNGKNVILKQLENGCIECVSHSRDDCGYTRLSYNGKHDRLFRVIYKMHYGDIPKGMLIRHKCDHPYCCNIEHLEIGTPKDNVRDMIERGKGPLGRPNPKCRGTKNSANKITESQVKEIYLSKLGCKRLSKQYNISSTSILLIKKKKMWKWLTDTLD